MDNDDDVVIEDCYILTDAQMNEAKRISDDVEVIYRIWANGSVFGPNYCVRIIPLKGLPEDKWPTTVMPPHIMHEVWANIDPAEKEAAKARSAALRRVAA
jgi:hypothetical protein